jgi:hypothetical protein
MEPLEPLEPLEFLEPMESTDCWMNWKRGSSISRAIAGSRTPSTAAGRTIGEASCDQW